MERLYGDYQCNVCHQSSRLGWVYLCNQDDGQDPSNDSLHHKHKDRVPNLADQKEDVSTPNKSTYGSPTKHGPDNFVPEFRMPTANLPPWIEQAISHGHYTPEENILLQAQRQNVVMVANAAIEQYEREVAAKNTHLLHHASPSDGAAANAITFNTSEHRPSLLQAKMFPYCRFRACQACRPTFRERTWERFENVFARDSYISDEFTQGGLRDSRPLASREIMRTIGLKAGSSPVPPTHSVRRPRTGSVSDSDLCPYGMIGSRDASSLGCPTRIPAAIDVATPETQDVADQDPELDIESSRFRDNIMRAVRGAVNRNHSSGSVKKRKMASDSKPSIDRTLGNIRNNALLQEAVDVPLPSVDSMDSLAANFRDAGEVHLAKGDALTEESADLGTADIITSV